MTSDRGFTVQLRACALFAGVIASSVAAADPPTPAPALGTLSLEQAIQLALTRNERSSIAELNVVEARAGVERARVAFLPVLVASGADAYRPWDKAPKNVGTGSLTLSQPLLNPSAFPLYDQAKHQLDATAAQTIDDKRQLEFDAAKAFVQVLLADKVVEAAARKLDTSKSNLADTTAQ